MAEMENGSINNVNVASLNEEQKRALLSMLLSKKKKKPLVLSTAQERMWQLDQIVPGNPVYNFQSAITLTGKLDHHALTQAVNAIVVKHETLRTCYGRQQGKPDLSVVPALSVEIEKYDWRGISTQQQQSDLQQATSMTAQKGFDITQPPLFRLQSYQMASERYVLVLTMHHIISDLLSLDLFFEELSEFYAQCINGKSPVITELTWTYNDYAHGEHQSRPALLQSNKADFWRSHLTDAPRIDWFSDYPRPKVATSKAMTAHFVLKPDIVQAVETLAREERVTPFVILLSIYYVLQWAASGCDDQLVAVPNAGRTAANVEGLIGMFSSPIPMRVDLSGLPNMKEVLQRVKEVVLAVTDNAELPFADIVDIAQANSGGNPLFLRSMFSFINRMKVLSFPNMELERTPTERGISDFDLFMTIYRDKDHWRGVFECNSDIFGQQRAQQWAQDYVAMVEETITPGVELPISVLAKQLSKPRCQQIAVAATFTADLLEGVIDFWQQELYLPTRLKLAPYNQVFQVMMDSSSELYQEGNTLNVLLIRPEDWVRYNTDHQQRNDVLMKATHEFIDIVRQVKFRAPLFIYLCQSSKDSANNDTIQAAKQLILSELSNMTGVKVFDFETTCAKHQLKDIYDAQSDEIGHIPYNQNWFAAMGTELVRQTHVLSRPPYKVIALDCDNTLWQGVCGEDGVMGVQVTEPFRVLQQFVLKQIEAGMIVCLVSKNEERDVLQVFENNPGMLLRQEHIVGHRINWNAKSDNLRSLAAELKLGLDSFIFIDDNPVECAEVQSFCPEVLTLQLPKEPVQIPSFLNNIWAFDKYQVSQEDRQRTTQYLQNRKRDILRQEQSSFSEFLAKLALKVEFLSTEQGEHLLRIAQLSHRTNQFNNSGIYYDESGLRQAILEGKLQVTGINVEDRFGSYGLVGALIYETKENIFYVNSFFLSCRVLGKGVEHQIIAWLGHKALNCGINGIRIVFKKLSRNQPIKRFLSGLEGQWDEQSGMYIISARDAANTTFNPDNNESDVINESLEPAQVSQVSDVHTIQQKALTEIASQLNSLDKILLKLEQSRPKRRINKAIVAPAQGETEQLIADIWQSVLRIDKLNRDDNFFEIGGNSLLLVQVNGRLNEHYGSDIAITTLFQFPTISSLARHLNSNKKPSELNINMKNRASHARMQLQQRMNRLGERKNSVTHA